MNANHTVAGFFDGSLAPNSSIVTISGTGSIILQPANLNGFACDNSSDGSSGNVTVAVPLTGVATAGVCAEEPSGQQFLNGTNTYQGGTYLGYSGSGFGSIWNFNNSASFGASNIIFLNCKGGALVAEGTSAITIPNGFVNYNEVNEFLNIVGVAASSGGVTFSGPWILSGGTPGQGGGIYATNGVVLPVYGQVGIGSGGAVGNLVTISGNISGTNLFSKYGVATLALTAHNTFSGTMVVSNGTLALTNGGSISNVSALSITPNGSFDVTGVDPYFLSANTVLEASGTNTTVGNGAATLNDTAPGGTINLGTQPIILGYNPVSVTGDTTHQALYVANGALTFNGNQITVSNNSQSPLGVGVYTLIKVAGGTINGAPGLAVAVIGNGLSGGTEAYTQVSGGVVNMIVTNSGVNSPDWDGADFGSSPNWSDPNNWTGLASPIYGDQVTVSGSTGLTPVMDYNNILSGLTFDSTAGAFNLTNSGGSVLALSGLLNNNSSSLETISLPLELNNSTVQINLNNGPLTINGPISDNGTGLNVNGIYAMTLNGANTYYGGTTNNGSILTIGGSGTLGNGNYAAPISSSGGSINYNSSASDTWSGPISGTSPLNVAGPGALTISGQNTFSGNITLTGGSLTVGGSGDLGDIGGTGNYNGILSNGSSFTYASTASTTINTAVTGAGTLTESAGTLTLASDNSFTGPTVLTGGTLKVTGDLGDPSFTGTGTYSANISGTGGSLIYAGSGTQTLSGTISGNVTVGVSSGVLNITGANTYTGGTSLTGTGTLNIASISDTAPSNMGSNTFTFGGGTFNYTGTAPVTTGRLFHGNSGNPLTTFNLAGPLTITNRLTATSSGLFTVIANGPATLTLANTGGDDAYVSLAINGPVVLAPTSAANAHAIGSSSYIGATGSLMLAGTGGYDIYSGVAITNVLGGTFDLGGQNNTFSSLYLASPNGTATLLNSIASTTSIITNTASNVCLLGNTVIGGAGNITLATPVWCGVSGSTLTYSGSGTLTLEATNYANGAITVSNGALLLGKVGATNGSLVSAAAPVEVKSGATFGCAATTGVCGVASPVNYESGAKALFTLSGGNSTTNGKLFITNNLGFNNNAVTINVSGTSAPAAGTYVLVTNTGTLSGSVATGTPTVTGAGLASGSTATISMVGNSVVLTITAANPVFSNLTPSQTVPVGDSTVTLSGRVSASGIYPTNGETVTITINGNAQTAMIKDSTGDFTNIYNASTIPASPTAYAITYSYGGDTLLNSAVNTSTTLTVGSPTMPTITSVGVTGMTLNLTATNATPNGPYVLLSTTNLALALTNWTPVLTNNADASGNINLSTNVVNPAIPAEFFIIQNP
jgi:autotransporter-associated beta strand protein